MKKRFGLLGRTLGHSRSRILFNEYIKNPDYTYELCEIERTKLNKELLLQYDGLNVTIPYKKEVIQYLDELDETTKEIQSVNCIVNDNGKLVGHNTDYIGIAATLDAYIDDYKKRSSDGMALILGNGGVSATIQYYFKKNGIPYDIVGRGDKSTCDYNYWELTDLSKYKFIVNATPVGMFPNVDSKPNIPYETIKPFTVVFDLVYNPVITKFLAESFKHTLFIESGEKMLYEQAKASYKYWKLII